MGKRARKNWCAAAAALAIVECAIPAMAQTSGTWINPFGGSWQDPANWTSNPLYPDGGGVATLGSTTFSTVNVSSSGSIALSELVIDSHSRYSISGIFSFSGPAVFDIAGPLAQSLFGSSIVNAHGISRADTTQGLVKNGPGAARIGLFDVTGGITINDGTLVIGANTPLGTTPQLITLNGGALTVSDIHPAIPHPFMIGSDGGIIRAGGAMQFQGGFDGTGPLLLLSNTKNAFTLLGSSTFSGALTAKVPVRLHGPGTLFNVGELFVYDSLLLDNSGSISLADRLNDAAPITLHGGMIAGTFTAETVGTVTLAGGRNGLGSLNASVTTPQVIRQNRATLGIGSSVQFTSAAPALSGNGMPGTPDVGIVPWTRRNSGLFVFPVTVEPGGLMRALDATEQTNLMPTGISTANVQLTSNTNVATPVTVNSLQILNTGTPTLAVSGPGTITVSSGAVFFNRVPDGQVSVINTPLDFGSAEGIIHTVLPTVGGTVKIDGPISGSKGLTIAGSLRLNGASTYTGTTTLQGHLTLSDDVLSGVPGPLGADTSPVVIVGAESVGITLMPSPTEERRFERDVIIRNPGNGSVTLGTASTAGATLPAVWAGDIDFEGILALRGNSGTQSLMVSGDLSGPGTLRLSSGAVLSGNNSFTGGFESQGSVTGIGSDTAFGAGTIWFGDSPAVYAHGGPRTLSNPVVIQFSLTVGGDQPLTFAGPVDLFGNAQSPTIRTDNAAPTTLLGDVFNGGLRKNGGGLLQMKRAVLSVLNIVEGQVKILPNGTAESTSFVRALTIVAGASLDLTDNDLIVDYTGSTVFPAIRTMILDQRIRSSLSDATRGLGYLDNATRGLATFSGQLVDETSILIKFTLFGDADLDGDVDGIDVGSWAQNFTGDLGGAGTMNWSDGDWDYDGDVDGVDVGLWAQNFTGELGGAGLSDVTVTWPANPQAAALLQSLGVTLVPEPEIACMLAAIAMLSRHRRVK